MKSILFGLILLLNPYLMLRMDGQQTAQFQQSESYCNGRYEFCVVYPGDYFIDKTLADNSDGLQLATKDHKTQLSISAAYNILDQDLMQLYYDLLEGFEMEGKQITDDDVSVYKNELTGVVTLEGENAFIRILDQKEYYVILLLSSSNNSIRELERIGKRITFDIAS